MTKTSTSRTKRKAAKPRIPEKAYQAQVIKIAKMLGWRVHHSRSVQLANGRYATPLQGHAGLPDLILAKDGRVVFIELKGTGGSVQDSQLSWATALTGDEKIERGRVYQCSSHAYVLAWPEHWDVLLSLLRGEPRRKLSDGGSLS